MSSPWNWPGSRWWKCDLHVHTRASCDASTAGPPAEWVAAACRAGLEVAAVTDHNTSRGIDEIHQAAALAAEETLHVFPGVELTAEGAHLLVLFDKERNGAHINAFLSRCEIGVEEFGRTEAHSRCTFLKALEHAANDGALAIAAHADDERGIWRVFGPSIRLQEVLGSEHLAAVEIRGDGSEFLSYLNNQREGYVRLAGPLAQVVFSDAHRLEDIGRRFTWIKMTRPTLGGLRLALADGLPAAVRSDADAGDPNRHAALAIEELEIEEARYMGRGTPLTVRFNPWLNAVIGGRGTGKSTLVELLRIALRREAELPETLRKEFEEKRRAPRSRIDRGLLTETSRVRITYRLDGARFRIQWAAGADLPPAIERWTGTAWEEEEGDVARRFPVRLYSQKQIFELAQRPEALLGIVDDAPTVDRAGWQVRWKQEESRFLSLRAKGRELEAGLADEGSLRAQLSDLQRKLDAFESSGHREVLRTFQNRRRQERAVEERTSGLEDLPRRLRDLAREALPSQLPPGFFDPADPADRSLLDAADRLTARLEEIRAALDGLADRTAGALEVWRTESRESNWTRAVSATEQEYQALVAALRGTGAGDPAEYGRLVQDRQLLEQRLIQLAGDRQALADIEEQARASLERLEALRRDLTDRRQAFLANVVGASPHVRIEVVPYGDESGAERGLRELLGTELFENDIRSEDGSTGCIADLYRDTAAAGERRTAFEASLRTCKAELATLGRSATPAGGTVRDRRFKSFLAGRKPEVFDRLDAWFPEDGLDVRHSARRGEGGFRPLAQGSPGQKAAAILAFLLAYGEEPMVLDQPEDDLDNQLISDLIVRQLQENKRRRQLIVVTHNPNLVVNGDAELVLALEVVNGQTRIAEQGGLQEAAVREEVCRIMEGGREALTRRYRRIAGNSGDGRSPGDA